MPPPQSPWRPAAWESLEPSRSPTDVTTPNVTVPLSTRPPVYNAFWTGPAVKAPVHREDSDTMVGSTFLVPPTTSGSRSPATAEGDGRRRLQGRDIQARPANPALHRSAQLRGRHSVRRCDRGLSSLLSQLLTRPDQGDSRPPAVWVSGSRVLLVRDLQARLT